MTVADAPSPALPRTYLTWLSGFTVGRLGDATLAFALGWAAAGLGGTTAALVLVLGGLPRLVLLVVGGAVADRFGARRLLVVGEAALVVLTCTLALAVLRWGTPAWLLLGSSLTLGTVTAFCLPASGSMPRRLVPDHALPRALALRQGVNQVLLLAAAPLGGLLVAVVGLPVVAGLAAAASGVALCVLVAVRETPCGATTGSAAPRLDVLDGVRVVLRNPGLRAGLVVAGCGAALVLPVASLLVPLLGRASGWGPGPTGGVTGAVGVGALGAALLAARRHRSGLRTVGAGLAVSAAGTAVIALAPVLGGAALTVAVVGGVVLGFGSGAFAARLAPVLLGGAPRTHLARVQALVGLAQLAPTLVTTAVLGAGAERTSPAWALGATAAGLAACAAWARARVTA